MNMCSPIQLVSKIRNGLRWRNKRQMPWRIYTCELALLIWIANRHIALIPHKKQPCGLRIAVGTYAIVAAKIGSWLAFWQLDKYEKIMTNSSSTEPNAGALMRLPQLFLNHAFRVPNYPRTYSWEKNNVSDLLQDIDNLIDNEGPDYMHYAGR